jgi:hypothetical protein
MAYTIHFTNGKELDFEDDNFDLRNKGEVLESSGSDRSTRRANSTRKTLLATFFGSANSLTRRCGSRGRWNQHRAQPLYREAAL